MLDKSLKILIAGDSFSSTQLSNEFGWPLLLSNICSVTNMSQPGVGEYKILNQLKSQNLDHFDYVIVSHTSPNRVHVDGNPLYPYGHMYRSSDLIFTDVESKSYYTNNTDVNSILFYFHNIFDIDYYKFIHTKCCEEIDSMSKTYTVKFIHITHFNWDELYLFPELINFFPVWIKNKGDYCHYNRKGNAHILDTIIRIIKNE